MGTLLYYQLDRPNAQAVAGSPEIAESRHGYCALAQTWVVQTWDVQTWVCKLGCANLGVQT